MVRRANICLYRIGRDALRWGADTVLWIFAAVALGMWVLSFQQEDPRASVTATAAAVPAALAAILWSIRQHQKTTRQQERQRALD